MNATLPALKVKAVHPGAILPTYATLGAACFDLYAVRDVQQVGMQQDIHPGSTAVFRTGLAFEIPSGWCMLIFSRSGHGFKNDIRLANCVGVIDSDYRGEVLVKLTSDEWHSSPLYGSDEKAENLTITRFSPGDRIAQAMLVPTYRVGFTEVKELSDTARGTGGFGSTGA